MRDVRPKECSYLSRVMGSEPLPIQRRIKVKVEIQEVFSTVILVHAYIAQLKVYLYVLLREEGGKCDELVPKIFNELVVNVGDPDLKLDGHVLKE